METLSKTQSATELVEDINSNLQEMSSQVEVAVTDSATTLVSTLNTALGVNTLNADDDADTFVAALNTAFENAGASSWPSEIADFSPTKYGAEMDDTVAKVNALKDDADFIMLVSTDVHYEQNLVTTVGDDDNVPLNKTSSGTATTHPDTFTPMMSNHCEFLRRAKNNGIKVDAIANLGDFFDGHRVDYVKNGETVLPALDACAQYIGRMTSKYKALSDTFDVPLIFAIGNHDDNRDSSTGTIASEQDVYNWFIKDLVVPTGKDESTAYYGTQRIPFPVCGVNYHIDFDSAKIRVVVIYCQLTSLSQYAANKYTIPDHSVAYLQNRISDLPSDYKILLLGHLHPCLSELDKGGSDDLMTLVESNSNKFIAYIFGHAHRDWVRGDPVASIEHVCGLKTGWRDSNDLWSVIAIQKGSGLNGLIHLIRFGQNGAWAYKDANNVWHCDQSGDYKIHYNPIVWSNQNITLEPTISDVTSWAMMTKSWYTWATRADGDTTYNATNFASITPASDNSSCDVSVNSSDASYPQIICVRAKNADTCEFWFIKIPKTT